jgi:hypothetical protein
VIQCAKIVVVNTTGQDNCRRPDALRRKGFAAGTTFGVSVNGRLLRPGMTQATFSLLADLDDYRNELQGRLGLVVDLRVFCRIASRHREFGPRINVEIRRMRGADVSEQQAAEILTGMLWPQSVELRMNWQQPRHPFRPSMLTERELVRFLFFSKEEVSIPISRSTWRAEVSGALIEHGTAVLTAPESRSGDLSSTLLALAVEPIDVGWMQLYAAVERIELRSGELRATILLRKLV